MIRTLFSMAKTYATVKAVEWVARAFQGRKAAKAKPTRRTRAPRRRATA